MWRISHKWLDFSYCHSRCLIKGFKTLISAREKGVFLFCKTAKFKHLVRKRSRTHKHWSSDVVSAPQSVKVIFSLTLFVSWFNDLCMPANCGRNLHQWQNCAFGNFITYLFIAGINRKLETKITSSSKVGFYITKSIII